jgi:hypothetical protein
VSEEVKRVKREAKKSTVEIVADKQTSGNDAEGASADIKGSAEQLQLATTALK